LPKGALAKTLTEKKQAQKNKEYLLDGKLTEGTSEEKGKALW